MQTAIRKLWKDQDGTAAVEYALLMAIMAVGTMGAFQVLAERVCETVLQAAECVRVR